ncbi:Uncharacterized protein Adt_12301 [Abeliophyllum distichum]|uniref:Uncharacterized protein n=1 Tax=Abeliophyllum distichum TaxID=126358 RepID=A0ABD1UQC3_9LAMI
MDQTECHLEVGNTGYESYDSPAKRRLLVSFGLFFRVYYKRRMLDEQSVNLSRASVVNRGVTCGLTLCTKCVILRDRKRQLRAYFMHFKRGLKYSFEFGNSSGEVGFQGLLWA